MIHNDDDDDDDEIILSENSEKKKLVKLICSETKKNAIEHCVICSEQFWMYEYK